MQTEGVAFTLPVSDVATYIQYTDKEVPSRDTPLPCRAKLYLRLRGNLGHDSAQQLEDASERAMRPVAMGRRNYMFFGSDNGGRTAPVFYSLIASAKRHGVDPFVYLRDVLSRTSDHPSNQLRELLPEQWKLAQAAKQAEAPLPAPQD